ncbi:MAG TPA: hypothetical protein VLJ42_01555 [Solirubrobacteraceae bacterium]|nr:hypothetical protein [Solirubrobacteraceae bacterium]
MSSNAFTLNERGQTSGTVSGPLTIHLTITSARITATFKISPHGGSISGRASASFKVVGSHGYFGGTLQVTHGSGRYAHASGNGLGISGIINRQNYDLTVHVNGKMHL